MKFIHLADVHASKARCEEAVKIISTLISTCENEDVDAVVFAGDFWDSTITNTRSSGFERIVDFMSDLCHATKVIMVYGTPSHEPAGSLEVFRYLGADVHENASMSYVKDVEIICIPEPRMSKFDGDSTEDKYRNIQKYFSDIAEHYKNKTGKRVVVFHGDVEGAKYQNGQPVEGGKTAMPINVLKSFDADYYALGHIHQPQKIKGLEAYYSGSACPVNFGETHNASFKIIEL